MSADQLPNDSGRLLGSKKLRWRVTTLLLVLLAVAQGCGEEAPPPEGRTNIETVAGWYSRYRWAYKKPPPDEAAFVAYIQKQLKAQARNVTLDPDEMLTSPRDGKKYVVQYGKLTSKNPEQNVAVYEQEGYNGLKLMAYESARSEEVDDAKLQSLLEGN